MSTRRLLLLVPIAIVVFLVQSCLWVPTYTSPDRGDIDRSSSYVEASIGDAKILNPILNADTASSRITGLVFDGLLGLDENLEMTPRLATGWAVAEKVYLLAREPEDLARDLSTYVSGDTELSALITRIEMSAATERAIELPPEEKDGEPRAVTLSIPPRVQLSLTQVVPDLAQRLAPVFTPSTDVSDLVAVDGDATLTAEELSERVPTVEHNPEVVFDLREGVSFHDGHPFDAGDVVFTWKAIMDPKNLSPIASSFEPVANIEVLSPHKVRVVYKRLFSPAVLAWSVGILPEHLLNDSAMETEMASQSLSDEAKEAFGLRNAAFNRQPVGTGAYRFEQWQSDVLIRLSANEAHWDGVPALKRYVYRVMPDPLTQELEAKAGVLDVYSPQPYQVERYRRDERFASVSLPGDGYSYIAYNVRKAPFDDARVRRALSMAIDTDAIIRYVLFGEGEPATGPYPVNSRWNDRSVKPVAHDPDGAVRLLEQAGYVRGDDGFFEKDGKTLEFTLISNQGNLVRKAILSIAQDAWRRIGVRANTQVFEWAVFLEDFVNPGKFDALVLGWRLGVDPDLYQLWHSSQTGTAQLNFTGYINPEVDRIIEAIRSEYDPDTQQKLAFELHNLLAADQPYTFLFAPRKNYVLNHALRERAPDGNEGEVRTVASGNLYQNFTRWTKAALTAEN